MRGYRHSLMVLSRRARKNLDVGTQSLRSKLLLDLEKMFDMAKNFAANDKLTPRQRQIWTRIAAYIGQVMNSLSKTFDEAAVTKDLEQLEKMIHEAMAKRKDKGTQTATSGTSGS